MTVQELIERLIMLPPDTGIFVAVFNETANGDDFVWESSGIIDATGFLALCINTNESSPTFGNPPTSPEIAAQLRDV